MLRFQRTSAAQAAPSSGDIPDDVGKAESALMCFSNSFTMFLRFNIHRVYTESNWSQSSGWIEGCVDICLCIFLIFSGRSRGWEAAPQHWWAVTGHKMHKLISLDKLVVTLFGLLVADSEKILPYGNAFPQSGNRICRILMVAVLLTHCSLLRSKVRQNPPLWKLVSNCF